MKFKKLDIISLSLLFCCSSLGRVLSATRKARQTSCDDWLLCDGVCLDELDIRGGFGTNPDKADQFPSECDCGVIKGEGSTSIRSSGNASEVNGALEGWHPWHVGIYRASRLICTGTLIYEIIVITAASCLYDNQTPLPYEASSLHVTAGKVEGDFNVTETSQQNFTVSRIVISDGYEGESNGFQGNLAIIMLTEPIKRTDDVKPICIWEESQLPSDDKISESGWITQTLDNRTLNPIEARVELLQCHNSSTDPLNQRFFSDDKFCLNFNQGVEVNDIDMGGAVDILSQGRHYLVGVLSLNRTGNAYGLATEIRKYIPWIQNTAIQLKQEERLINQNPPASDTETELQLLQENSTIAAATIATTTATIATTTASNARVTATTSIQNRSCRIPEGHEKFTLTKCNNTKGCADVETASHASTYNVTCLGNTRFAESDTKEVQMNCINGEWTPSLNEYKCVALCPIMEYKTLELQCFYSRTRVSCNQNILAGTLVYSNCKRNYEIRSVISFANQTMCRSDGSYLRELTECTPVCGKTATSKVQALISKGTHVKYPKYPWHIALYWKMVQYNGSIEYEYKCGGTIISRNKVLTAAHCIWDPNSGLLKEPTILKVASGKIYSKWDALDVNAQKVGVVEVISASNFKGVATRYEQDIAVLILSEDLQLSDFTMPACLDLDLSSGGVPLGQRGHVVGWGREDEVDFSASEILQETWMEYLDVNSCHIKFRKHSFQEYLLSDKFCVLYTNGSGTQQGDSGGGLTFQHDGLHYVYGVVSIKKLGQNEFAAVTNVTAHRYWLRDILATNGLGRGCTIPDGAEIFHLKNCGDLKGCKNKDWSPINSTYNVTCAEGYGFLTANQTSVEVICSNGKWIPDENEWKCLALCPGMEYNSLSLSCTYLGSSVLCSEPLIPGTKVRVKCKRRYKLSPFTPITSFVHETTCGIDGRIQQELKMCESACGRMYKVRPLILGGTSSLAEWSDPASEYPWHILIFKRKTNHINDYEYICGGTLIDSNKVLTVAHCVWEVSSAVSPDMLAVVSGKKNNLWNSQEFTQQKVRVSKVIPGLNYDGSKWRYLQDIAVLILSNDLQLSDYTMPACLDLDLSAGGIPTAQRGQVIIWDLKKVEEVEQPTNLKEVWMEYADLNQCRNMTKDDDFFNYLVKDKFCLLYNNGTGPHRYDSGTGITFVHDDLHYVYGVVALKRTGDDPLAAVTDVTAYRNWLLYILSTY